MPELPQNSTPDNCLDCYLNFVRNIPKNSQPSLRLHKLTERERDVVIALARGLSNKEIAKELDLAESTIKIHIQGILRKLNLTSRLQAAVFVVKHGLDKK
jgi:two-component system nitrate/nitrite response regulator NarL